MNDELPSKGNGTVIEKLGTIKMYPSKLDRLSRLINLTLFAAINVAFADVPYGDANFDSYNDQN